jgi:hypothetical protein
MYEKINDLGDLWAAYVLKRQLYTKG